METIRIPLANGHGYALIDAEDLHLVTGRSWYRCTGRRTKTPTFYARTHTDRNHYIFMHTLITGFLRVDHENGDGLDNRKLNLREATASQNGANSGSRGGSSQFKGVSWENRIQRWRAVIRVDGKLYHLGYFHDEMEAAQAYDTAAHESWGPFARLNHPTGGW